MTKRGLLFIVVASTLCTAGCTEEPNPTSSEDEELLSELAGQDAKSDAVSWLVKSAGVLELGFDTPVAYTNSPRYRSVKFHATKGDQLEIFVQGGGDATAWLFDSHMLPIAHNDDMYEGTTDANVEVESLLWSGDYYVVFRDKQRASSTLNVAVAKVNLPTNAPSVEAVGAAYEALLTAGTLAAHQVSPNGLPFLTKGLYNRWNAEKANVPGLQVAIYNLDVGGQPVYFVRKYLPGTGIEAGAYVAIGAMIGIAGGSNEHIDTWQN